MPGNSTESPVENWNTALKYIAGRKAAEESLGFLAHVSGTIRDTREIPDVIPAVAAVCVPFLGSAISLDAPATQDEPVVQCPAQFAAALEGVRTLARATTDAQFVISSHEGLAKRTDPEHLELLRGWDADSAVAVSLAFRGVPGGHLVLVRGAAHRRGPISASDLALISEVAGGVAAFTAFATQLTAAGGR